MEIICKTPDDLPSVAQILLKTHVQKKVFAFFGEMGSGKTTFIKALCKVLGAGEIISSPTFSIINEYITESGGSLFHFDFYRLKKQEEAIQIGIEDYFYSGKYCFIEWPEKISAFLPEDIVKVNILVEESTLYRKICF